jgi:hypothetical protein
MNMMDLKIERSYSKDLYSLNEHFTKLARALLLEVTTWK